VCHGEVKENWQKKMKTCRQCDVFSSMMPEFLAEPAL
jgi:hypothetical protein